MIKRTGQRGQSATLPPLRNMTNAEQTAYSEAFGTIKNEYQTLCSISDKLREIERTSHQLGTLDSQSASNPTELSDPTSDRNPWEICTPLIQLSDNEVLLCKRQHEHGVEYAVIDHSPAASVYAKANGSLDILGTSDDPRQALQDYLRSERQTLELMANDIAATVRLFMAERFPRQDVSRVTSAITRICKKVARLELSETPAEFASQKQTHDRGVGV